MSHRIGIAIVLTVAAALGGPAALAQDAPVCPEKKFAKEIEKPMRDVEKAFTSKAWDEVLAKLAKVEESAAQFTLFDKYWVAEFKGRAYLSKKQYAQALPLLEESGASPCAPETDRNARNLLLVRLANETGDFKKLIAVGASATQQPGYDPEIEPYLGNAYYAENDNQNARVVLTKVVTREEAAGKVPDAFTYRLLHGACIKLKDVPCAIDQMEKLVTHYPTPDLWHDLIDLLLRVTKESNQLLFVWRLADNQQVIREGGEYLELAQLALGQGLPGEALSALEKGAQKGLFADARSKQDAAALTTDAKTAADFDKANLAKEDAAARALKTGDADVKLGAAYLSYGDPAKAIEALQRGLSKGGVKKVDDANLLLGIAFLRAGNKPEAAKALDAVTLDPKMAQIARLWKVAS